MSIQYYVGCLYLVLAGLAILYGLYCLLLTRWRARLSFWRLFYRIFMLIRRKPAKPPWIWRIRWLRAVGVVSLFIGLIWLTQLHPEIRWLSKPLYDPNVHHWQVENGDGSPSEQRILTVLEEVTRSRLRPDTSTGMCIGVLCGGKTFTLSLGRKTLNRDEAPGADTVFDIGSITKVFTSTALASLAEAGKVYLDEPVSTLLPPDWAVPSYPGRVITLKDLAAHTSALPRMPDTPAQGAIMDALLLNGLDDPYRNMTPEYLRSFLSGYQLTYAPGLVSEYSNLGGGLLGYALSRRAQQSYAAMIEEAICAPLGMKDTAIQLNPEQTTRLAQGYIGPIAFGRLHIALPMTRWTMSEAFQGCGGLASTVHDMLIYLHAQMAAPEGPLGSALARVQEPLFDTSGIDNCKTGLALMSWNIDGLDGPMYWHNGGTGGYNSFMGFSKQHQVGVIMLAAGSSDEELCREIIKALAKEPAACTG